jgi:methylene-tetrahydrofolate reductase-like protein
MSLLGFLQDRPHWLEVAYDATERTLFPFRRWLKPGGRMEWLLIRGEELTKGPLFDCRMCGQCVLHSTGMTCPMTCPKNLRNGPCGGVRPDGRCEVLPDRPCVWAQAWQRSKRMPRYGSEILHVLPPVNKRLQGTSAWINELNGIAQKPPPGWSE